MSSQRSPLDHSQIAALGLLVLLYVVIALAHTCLAPLTAGPDELAHYEYVRFIADHGRLPLNGAERAEASYKSDQPPLYHLLAAWPVSFVDPNGPPDLKRVSDHPRRQLIERTRHAWGLYNTEDEQWPYRAEILRWQIGRWLAVLFGAATVVVTFFIAREIFSPWPSLAAAAVVAFVPRYALTGSMLNYETLLAFVSALFLGALVRMAREGEAQRSRGAEEWRRHDGSLVTRHSSLITRYALFLGLLAGLAITTKLSALILPVEIVVALWVIGRYRGWSWRLWLRLVLVAGVATLVAVSWWFGFIVYRFNTVAEEGWWVGLLRPLIAADASDATTNRLLNLLTQGEAGFTGAIENLDSGPPWEWAAVFFRTFWVAGIEQHQPLGWPGLLVALGFCGLAGWGLVKAWRSEEARSRGAGAQPFQEASQGSRGAGERRSKGAEEQRRRDAEQNATSHASRITHRSSRPTHLILLLLILHLLFPFLLPLIRYAVTFSLADTAQGRHVLFSAAPAFAILLIWGWATITHQEYIVTRQCEASLWDSSLISHHSSVRSLPVGLITRHASRIPHYVLRFTFYLPPLFLFTWCLVQLWLMTWAYYPLLPVRTVPVEVTQPSPRPVNDYVTLVGHETRLDPEQEALNVELLWLSTAVSPVDYLTEVSLVDETGDAVRQWLGYSAQGRYPTRAWDVGDYVRDRLWLPTANLEAGRYRLNLNLLPTAQTLPPEVQQQQLAAPITLTTLNLAGPTQASAPDEQLLITNYQLPSFLQLWRDGHPLVTPETFRYRETVFVTVTPGLSPTGVLQIRGPLSPAGEPKIFEPARRTAGTAVFIVGPDWPAGDYQIELVEPAAGVDDQPQLIAGPTFQVIDRWEREFAEPPMPQRLEANFANQVKLLGYDLGANRVEAGGGIPLTLYWQGLDWLGNDYTIFIKLLSVTDQSVHGGRDRLPREGYRTLYWAPGEVISDPFGVPVDPHAPDGIYHINVGLYHQVGQQAVSLPLVENGQMIEASSINIGPIKIGNAATEFTLDSANPQVSLDQPFGETPDLTLLGYDLMVETNLHLTLYWRSDAPLLADYTTFVHLRDANGEIVAQQDQPPLHGAYPTSLWDPGEIIGDEVVVPLPEPLPAGTYSLFIGLYDFKTGVRLTVPAHPDNSLLLQTIEVAP